MSVEYIGRVWKDQTIRSRTDLLIMLALADWSNDQGESWPSTESLAFKSRCSQRSVHKRVLALVGFQKLEIQINGGRGNTNKYRLYPNPAKQNTATADVNPAGNDPKKVPKKDSLGAPDPSGTVRNRYEPLIKEGVQAHSLSLPDKSKETDEHLPEQNKYVPPDDEDDCIPSEEAFELSQHTTSSGPVPPPIPGVRQVPARAKPKPAKSPFTTCPDHPLARRICFWFKRPLVATWNWNEVRGFNSIKDIASEADLKVLETFYTYTPQFGEEVFKCTCMENLFRKWQSQLDLARTFKPKPCYNL